MNGSRTLKRARDDSQQRSRPVLAAELQPDEFSKDVQYLVLSNYGPGVAVDVRVTFEPTLPEDELARDGQSSVVRVIRERYAEPIPTFTPGMVLRNVYYIGRPGEGGQLVNIERAADRFTVTLTYRSMTGDHYSDRFTRRLSRSPLNFGGGPRDRQAAITGSS